MTKDRANKETKLPVMTELFKSVLKARDYEFVRRDSKAHDQSCELPSLQLLGVDKTVRQASFRVSATSGGKAMTVFARPVGNPITLKDVGAPRLIARGKIKDGTFEFVWQQPDDMDYAYLYAIEMSRERTLKRSEGIMLKV